jgi:hypothetical protein
MIPERQWRQVTVSLSLISSLVAFTMHQHDKRIWLRDQQKWRKAKRPIMVTITSELLEPNWRRPSCQSVDLFLSSSILRRSSSSGWRVWRRAKAPGARPTRVVPPSLLAVARHIRHLRDRDGLGRGVVGGGSPGETPPEDGHWHCNVRRQCGDIDPRQLSSQCGARTQQVAVTAKRGQ